MITKSVIGPVYHAVYWAVSCPESMINKNTAENIKIGNVTYPVGLS